MSRFHVTVLNIVKKSIIERYKCKIPDIYICHRLEDISCNNASYGINLRAAASQIQRGIVEDLMYFNSVSLEGYLCKCFNWCCLPRAEMLMHRIAYIEALKKYWRGKE